MNNTSNYQNHFKRYSRTFNINAHFISSNPKTTFNKKSVYPNVDKSAFVGPFSSIIGNVQIMENVFIAPNVSIRADEGFPFYIGANSNLQDGVILHGLVDKRVMHQDTTYSIYIGNGVSCAHHAIIHGPCKIGDKTFVGFNAIVFNAIVGEGCYISIDALVTGGVIVAPNRFVPAGAIVDTQEKADQLGTVPTSETDFAKKVIAVNTEFAYSYSLMFGDAKCSCGFACHSHTLQEILA